MWDGGADGLRLGTRIRTVGAAVLLAGSVLAVAGCSGDAGHHPAPRANVTGQRVLPASTWGDDMRLARAYADAREYPAVFDGVHCYCECHENMGHRSLLTCFESEHAASCDICLTEGAIVGQMHRQGRSLEQIRQAIDAQFRS